MRIHDRYAEGVFIVTAADGTEWTVNTVDFLTPRQSEKMLVRPDMIHQFAGHLARVWDEAGHGRVAVRADIWKSLNGRPLQRFVDPEVDLARVAHNRLGPDPWVLPLIEPSRGVRDNRLADAAAPGR